MRKSEINLIIMTLAFIVGLTNIFPSEMSVYDQYIIPIIQQNITPEHIFYQHITLLVIIFRILIIVMTFIDLVALLKYVMRYNIFGLRQILIK